MRRAGQVLREQPQGLRHLQPSIVIVWDGLLQPLPQLRGVALGDGPPAAVQPRNVVQLPRIAIMQEDLLEQAAPWVPGLQSAAIVSSLRARQPLLHGYTG